MAMKKGTRRGDGSMPGSAEELGGASGDGSGRGRAGRLRGSPPILRTPSVRRNVGIPEWLDSGQEKEDKDALVLVFDQEQ
jgi:hypothetical protein